jgi:hypothetical protein
VKVFWSYARNDNQKPAQKVLKLKNAFSIALKEATGNKECQVFFDIESINWGAAWKVEIEKTISDCNGLVAIMTPSFFNSRACIYEVKLALDKGRKIYPIYFRNCSNRESSFKENGVDNETNIELNAVSRKLRDINFEDFRDLRNKPIEEESVQNFIDHLADQLADDNS